MNDPLQSYASVVTAIANQLAKQAVFHDGCANWLDNKLEEKTVYKSNLNASWSSGISGIAYFFYRLSSHIDDPVYHKIKHAAAKTILLKNKDQSIDFYNGHLGRLYLLFLLDGKDEHIFEIANKIESCDLNKLPLNIDEGIGGMIAPLIHMDRHGTSDQLKSILTELLKSIMQRLGDTDVITEALSQKWMGHTTSIIGALPQCFHLAQYLEDTAASDLILHKIHEEVQSTLPKWQGWQQHGWIDQLLEYGGPYALGIAHGWAGLVQARVEMMPYDKQLHTEAQHALNMLMALTDAAIARQHWASNFSMAHGLAGIGSIFVKAYTLTNNLAYLSYAQHLAQEGYDRYYRTTWFWPSGVHLPENQEYIQTLGFMEGISGTGTFYLDLWDAMT